MLSQSIGEIKNSLKSLWNDREVPVMLWGPPGIGKTAAVWQVAEEINMPLWILRLSLMDIVDFRGVPVPDREQGVTRWLRPSFLPGPNDPQEGILFVDEVNTAMPAIQAMAYQLIQEGRVGEHILPKGWRRWSAGNNLEDRGVAYRMPAPLANRMVHLEVRPEFEDWRQWAVAANVHPLVTAYLTWAPKNTKDGSIAPFWAPPKEVDAKAFPTPRSWEMAGRVLTAFGDNLDAAAPSIYGTVGQGVGIEFLGFARNHKDLPSAEEILAGVEHPVPSKSDLILIIISTLVAKLCEKPEPSRIENFVRYVVKIPSVEYHVIAFKNAHIAGVTIGKMGQVPAFQAWARKNAQLIL